MAPWSASTQAGNSWATAEPEVVITAAGLPAARPRPRAKKLAERSSKAVWSTRPLGSSRAAATARGAERLPGQITAWRKPARRRASSSARAALRLALAVAVGVAGAAGTAGSSGEQGSGGTTTVAVRSAAVQSEGPERGWMQRSSSSAPAAGLQLRCPRSPC